MLGQQIQLLLSVDKERGSHLRADCNESQPTSNDAINPVFKAKPQTERQSSHQVTMLCQSTPDSPMTFEDGQ